MRRTEKVLHPLAGFGPRPARRVASWCLLLLAWALPLQAAQDAGPWLQRMSEAFREQSYVGTFVYAHGDQMSTLRVLHAGGAVEREKVIEMEGGMREVLRVGDLVSCRLPEADTGKSGYCPHTGPFSRAFFEDLDRVRENYHLRLAGSDRVAGRDAIAVAIEPRDAHRYAYQLWLDRDSAMLLRCLLRNDQGRVLERFQFTELEIGVTIPESEFRLGEGETTHHHLDTANTLQPVEEAGHWRVSWIPPGFSPVRALPAHAARSGARLFTDGLARVSVFVERLEERVAGETSRMGATVAVSRVVRHGGSDWLVTVVGEVPEATARRIAESVQLADG